MKERPENSILQLKDLIPIDIRTLRSGTRDIQFDLYLLLSEDNFCHVFSRTTGLDYKRLAQYMLKGVKQLYIRRDDEKLYQEFTVKSSEGILADPAVSPEKKVATLLNMTEQNIAELFTAVSVEDDTAANSQKVVNSYVKMMADAPNLLAMLLKLVSHGEYLYYHSIAVSIFSIFIAKATGKFDEATLQKIGLGGFLHDIGVTKLPRELVDSPAAFTREDWDQMDHHPKLGLNMLEKTPSIPDEVRYMIYQHHEETSGRGYPNQLLGPVIYYPAKIVAVADAFSAMISTRPYRPAYSVDQAIYLLQAQRGHHEPELLQILESLFLKRSTPAVA